MASAFRSPTFLLCPHKSGKVAHSPQVTAFILVMPLYVWAVFRALICCAKRKISKLTLPKEHRFQIKLPATRMMESPARTTLMAKKTNTAALTDQIDTQIALLPSFLPSFLPFLPSHRHGAPPTLRAVRRQGRRTENISDRPASRLPIGA